MAHVVHESYQTEVKNFGGQGREVPSNGEGRVEKRRIPIVKFGRVETSVLWAERHGQF